MFCKQIIWGLFCQTLLLNLLKMPGWFCVPPSADHIHMPMFHRWIHCRLANFQKQKNLFFGSRSLANRVFLTFYPNCHLKYSEMDWRSKQYLKTGMGYIRSNHYSSMKSESETLNNDWWRDNNVDAFAYFIINLLYIISLSFLGSKV